MQDVLYKQDRTYAAESLVPVRRLNAELYYEKDNVIYKITISNDSFSWTDERGNIMGKNSEDLQSLFYTIVINYSHYAYNSQEYQSEIMGRYKKKFWIEALFHKNDGYRTPIVLNPFRERGNIDINVETLDMVQEALEAGADIIMLDNMTLEQMQQAVQLIAGRAQTECSGNVTKENITALAAAGVDYISSGALTHSAPILDLSLKNLHAL